MRVRTLHSWDIDWSSAADLQASLAARLTHPALDQLPPTVAGVDVSYSKHDPTLHAAVVVMRLPDLEVLEVVSVSGRTEVPYVPGFLSFRELPVLVELLRRVTTDPGAILCDGQGIAHPRGLGLAAHLGLLVDVPTVGCAKSRLVGEHDEPGPRRGEAADLVHQGRRVGQVLRTRDGVKPMWISPGNGCDVEAAVRLTLACGAGFRMPEPTRLADKEVGRLRREARAAASGEA